MFKKKTPYFLGLLLLIFFLLGCVSHENYAPVVNAWQDPHAMKSRYRVQEGDTIYSIACAFEMDYRDLVNTNHLISPYRLRNGETLSLLAPVVPAEKMHEPEESMSECKTFASPGMQQKFTEKQPEITTAPEIVLPKVTLKPTDIKMEKPNFTLSKTNLTTTDNKTQKDNMCYFWPAEGKVIRPFNLQNQGGNKGVDISGKVGDPVKAVASGQVVYCGSSLPGYGNLIILKHNESYLSLYGNNRKILVKEGDTVLKGRQIAEMGQASNGTCMLHFEVRKYGKPINPNNFIQQR